MAAGSVSTHAMAILRMVASCRPDPFAAMVPATPEESTWVVETGSPYPSVQGAMRKWPFRPLNSHYFSLFLRYFSRLHRTNFSQNAGIGGRQLRRAARARSQGASVSSETWVRISRAVLDARWCADSSASRGIRGVLQPSPGQPLDFQLSIENRLLSLNSLY